MASAVVTNTSIAITYNQAVTCAAVAMLDFTYYYSWCSKRRRDRRSLRVPAMC